jgi:flagellar biosynthesis protein FliQ
MKEVPFQVMVVGVCSVGVLVAVAIHGGVNLFAVAAILVILALLRLAGAWMGGSLQGWVSRRRK